MHGDGFRIPFNAKSTPIVARCWFEKIPCTYRLIMLVFPVPLSPTTRTLRSISFDGPDALACDRNESKFQVGADAETHHFGGPGLD